MSCMRRSGCYSDGRNLFVAGALEPDQGPPVIVSVKQEFGARCHQDLAQMRTIDQSPKKSPWWAERRVMDQDDAEASTRLLERLGKPRKLSLPEPPGCQKWTARHTGRKRN